MITQMLLLDFKVVEIPAVMHARTSGKSMHSGLKPICWWAQYLAPAPDKQTWAPDKWYAHTKKTALYQDGWQLIKTSPSGLRPQARVEA